MFETATLSDGPAGKRIWTTGVGVAGESLLVAMLALAPMFWPQSLPNIQALMGPLIAPVPPAPPVRSAVVKPRNAAARTFDSQHLMQPTRFPPKPQMIDDLPDIGVPGAASASLGVPGGIGILDLPFASLPVATPPRPAAPPSAAETPKAEVQRVKIGGDVKMARLIHQVQPEYPPFAKQMRVSGTVELVGVIGVDGRIRELKPVSGNPLLIKAAVDAVLQWIYEPTTLNQQRVEVIAPITVTFRLN